MRIKLYLPPRLAGKSMDNLAIAVCGMLENDKSTIRAACLRTHMLDGLLEKHAEDPRVLRMALKLSNVRTGYEAVAKHIPAFLNALKRSGSTGNDEAAQLVAKLIIKMPIWGACDQTHILCAIQLCLKDVLQPDTLIKIMTKTLPATNVLALSHVPELTILTSRMIEVFVALTCRHNGRTYAPIVARICERALVNLFVRGDLSANVHRPLSLLNSIIAHMTMNSFNEGVFYKLFARFNQAGTFAPQVLTSLMSRYIQLDPTCVASISTTPEWEALLIYLGNALQKPLDPTFHVAPTFLLTATYWRLNGHDKIVPHMRAYMQHDPSKFRFQPTDDVNAIERVIACAMKLHVNCDQWKEQLAAIRTRETQNARLKSIGVDDMQQPHEFCCPMTMEVMIDPVVASDGHTYERAALQRIFESTKISPLTREKLDTKIVIPNHNLKKRIREYPDDIYKAIVASKVSKSGVANAATTRDEAANK